jgi:phosphatidylserine/phosphatidylglycerophosphate/cardiolipin synthase-like enzyme
MKRFTEILAAILVLINCSTIKYTGYEASQYSHSDEFKKEKQGVIKGEREYTPLMNTLVDNKYMRQMKDKYDILFKQINKINGWIYMELVIIQDGSVLSTRITKSTINNKKLERYLLRYSKTWQFGSINSNDTSIVIFPFVFSQ